MAGLTEEQLQELCREWQGILRVQDWDVLVKVVRGFNLGNKQGECGYTQSLRQATIRILDDHDWSNPDWPHDQEATLVHELLHLHFAPFMSDGEDDHVHIAQEAAIEQLSRALVKLKRKVPA